MKHSFFGLITFLFLSATTSIARADVVLFDEGIATQALSISRINGVDQVIAWNCPTDKWVKSLNDCTMNGPAIEVANLRNFVKESAFIYAHTLPKSDLSPFKSEELVELSSAVDVVSSASNKQALSNLADYRAKLTNVADILSHAPDSPAFVQQKQDYEAHISTLGIIENQVAQATQTLNAADTIFDDITHTLTDFIKNNNPKDNSPQIVMSSMMKDTLILGVMHRLVRSNRTTTIDNQKVITTNINSITYEISVGQYRNTLHLRWAGHSSDYVNDLVCNPMILNLPNATYVLSLSDDSMIHLTCITLESDYPSTYSLPNYDDKGVKYKFKYLDSVTVQDQIVTITVIAQDGSLYMRTFSVDSKNRFRKFRDDQWKLVF